MPASSSYSSSSSEELKHRSKRSRFRTRKDVVSKKKKRVKRSSGDSPPAKKRKGSKRKRDYEAKNKSYSKKKKKKKPRRDDSITSLSSRSSSCSTCQGHGISSDEVEVKRQHGKRGRERSLEEEVESPNKRSRYDGLRSPLCSQFSESGSYWSKEKVSVENNSRRLRSVITVVERDSEDRELNRDEHEEEIIFVHDDYPSCRSNDSVDVGSKRGDGDHILHVDLDKKTWLENEEGDDTAVSDFRQFDGSNPSSEEFGTTNPVIEKTTDVSGAIGSEHGDDLESVLRQRALENLRRFRGGLQSSGKTCVNQMDKNDGDEKAKQSSTTKAESVQIGFTEQDDNRVVVNSSKEDRAEVVASTEPQSVNGVRIPVVRKGAACSSQIDENKIDRNPGGNEAVSAKQIIACSTHQTAIAGNSKQKVNAGTSAVKPKLATPALTRQLSQTHSTLKQAPECKESQAKLVIEKTLDETASVTAPAVTQNSNNDGEDTNNACNSAAFESSSPKSTPGDTKSDKLQDESKEGSQFQQKTMSVMRGGEMVQVGDLAYHVLYSTMS